MKSPTPKQSKKKELGFAEAITELLTGKSITKLEWDNKKCYGLLMDERLTIHRDGKFHDWILSEADMRGDDWVSF